MQVDYSGVPSVSANTQTSTEAIGVNGKSNLPFLLLFLAFAVLRFPFQFIDVITMKHPIKSAINVFASLCVMVFGTMQAAQASDIWLDFSVPEADVVVTAPALQPSNSQSTPTLSAEPLVIEQTSRASPPPTTVVNSSEAKERWQQTQQSSKQEAERVALDFGVPNANSTLVPTTEFLVKAEPTTAKLTTPTNAAILPSPQPSAISPAPSTVPTPVVTQPKGITRSQQLTALRRAIIGQESAGKFYIVNPHSGALGYGQVMPANVGPWSRAALGRTVSTSEFLKNPDLQIKIIDHKLGQYLDNALRITGGNEAIAIKRVAAIWYSGNPNLYTSTRPQYYKGYRYPSIAAYSESVLRKYQTYLQG